MRAFYMNEAALVLPDGAVDRSTTHVRLVTPSGAKATFIVERLELEPGRTLREAFASYASDLARRLRGFTTLFERDTSLDGAPALELGVRWRNQAGEPMYTRQAHLLLETWTILAIEGQSQARQEIDGLFEPILASLRLRND